ncbi:MAG: hydroxyacid dehydrogenase [Deltaproteobacteria bacterium]|jgi:D-3-phosphoglycerate dehydrogenase|nr:hydroxyacid dehydrogenase [Deltaproteobacteria bacterium]
MAKVLISDKIEAVCPERLRAAGLEVDEISSLDPAALAACIGHYDALIIRSATRVDQAVLEAGASGLLKMVARAGAGLDNVDLEAARRLGVEVVNTPGLNANAVAELTVGLMIVLARRLGPAIVSLREGRWEKKGLSGTELAGKTLGLVGLGAVGRLTAAKAAALGLTPLAHDPLLTAEQIRDAGARPVELDELWSASDFVSLHLPKTPQTTNLVDEAVLARFKKTAFLINCARGGLVDEAALHRALTSGRLAGAAFDVFAVEPPGRSPLLELPNFVGAPHLGASTEEAQLGVALKAAELVAARLAGPGPA